MTGASSESLEPLTRQFREAVDLAQRGRRQQALQLFEACLASAARDGAVLSLEQLASLLQELAWCYADMGRRDEALQLYGQLDRILHQTPGWQAGLPPGVRVAVPGDYEPLPRLAPFYESLGIIYDNLGEPEQAQQAYRRAIACYTRLGNLPKAATVWQHQAIGCQKRQDWRGLQQAAEQMLALWGQVEGIYGQVWAWQYLAQAHANLGQLVRAVEFMEQAVAAERRLQHRDLARDEAILAELQQQLARRPIARLLRRLRAR